MHVSEARHCVSHCMQGRPLFHGLAALLQAHKLPEARQELRAATYLFCQQQQSDRNVTPFTTERPALWNILRDESKPCCRAGNLFFFALNAERVLLADSRASRPPLSRASQSVPALTLPSKNGPAHKCQGAPLSIPRNPSVPGDVHMAGFARPVTTTYGPASEPATKSWGAGRVFYGTWLHVQ